MKKAITFILKNLLTYVALIFIGIWKIIATLFNITTNTIWHIKENVGTYVFALFYQPLLILLSCLLFAKRIDQQYLEYKDGNETSLIIIGLMLLLTTIIIITGNLITEVMFRIINEEKCELFFKSQSVIYNYCFCIISIFAVYIALNGSKEDNFELLVFAILTFSCIIVTDAYNKFIFKRNMGKNIVKELLEQKEKIYNSFPK